MSPTIVKIVATEVVVPAKEGYVDCPAFGPSLFDKGSKWILEVHASDGMVGYGETSRNISEGSLRWAVQYLLGKPLFGLSWHHPVPPDLSGNDAYHPNPPVPYRFYEVDFAVSSHPGIHIGIQTALLDLWGKFLKIPVSSVLGGTYREWVATSWWFGRSNPEHAARQMEVGLKYGFRGVKIKATADDDVVGIVRTIKSVAGPKALVVVDPNTRFFRLSEALVIAHRLEEFENILLEDPFPFDVKEWQLFRQKSRLPLVFHCCGNRALAMAEHCCDHVNIGYPPNADFLGEAHMAGRYNMLCWHGSGVELGILDAFMLHCSAVARTCVLPGDAMGHRIRVDDLIEEDLEIREGALRVPTGPGLGVALDRQAMQKFAKKRFEIQ